MRAPNEGYAIIVRSAFTSWRSAESVGVKRSMWPEMSSVALVAAMKVTPPPIWSQGHGLMAASTPNQRRWLRLS